MNEWIYYYFKLKPFHCSNQLFTLFFQQYL